jgi:altronate dehydratase/ABC-type nitrate/sulfonate/bicarbonate transport system substrate-binding protein
MQSTFWGYRRENNRVGVRNHVIILPVDDLSNAAAEAVAHNIKGTIAIPHPYGRLQFGADLDLHFRTLIGAGSNPNVAAVVVIGIEDQWTKRWRMASLPPASRWRDSASSSTATTTRSCGRRKPLASTCSGQAKSTASNASSPSFGSRPNAANPTPLPDAAPIRRWATPSTSSTPPGCTLVFGETTELTGGEQIVAARCRDDKVRADFMRVFDRYQEVINRHKTSDLSDSQPTKGNIAGGLTTIEEKALGNIQKIGKKCVVDGVLDKAEMPSGPGLWFMDSSSAAAEMVTLCAASGYVVHFFPTGQGNVIGNPILPVIKICANPRTVRTMGEHVDVDTCGLLQRELTMSDAWRQAPRHDVPHRERQAHCRRSAGTPGVRHDALVRKRVRGICGRGEQGRRGPRVRHAPAAALPSPTPRTHRPRLDRRPPTAYTSRIIVARVRDCARDAHPRGVRMTKFSLRIVLLGALAFLSPAASAEMAEINVAQQYGIGYLSLMLMEEQKLIEKHAKAAGVDVKVNWAKFAGGNVMNDALLSNSLQFASGGVGPLITMWAKTKGNLDVKAVAALDSMPLYLNTRNPNVKTIKDFTEKDKIALPAVKVSVQAVTLQMAAEKLFGEGQQGKLDALTVSMSHPDAQTALLSGQSEVTAHFGSPPFQYQQLKRPGVHTVLSSTDVLGGPTTFNLVWTTAKFRSENPKLYAAFLKALEEATAQINKDKKAAAETYLRISKDKDTVADILAMLNDPAIVFTTAPQNIMAYANFMAKTGMIKVKPDSWKDLFFPDIHAAEGS